MNVDQLVVVLGDQLDPTSRLMREADRRRDVLVMAEVAEESLAPLSSKARTAFFLSAMRHFARERRGEGWRVHYSALDDPTSRGTLAGALEAAIEAFGPRRIVLLRPGDWRVLSALTAVAARHGCGMRVVEDDHFLTDLSTFAEWREREAGPVPELAPEPWPSLRLERFYRFQRRRLGLLLDERGRPVGGRWNFDAANRRSFGRGGPPPVPVRRGETPDATTRAVMRLVQKALADLPGGLEHFDWPVTRTAALAMLDDFVEHRLDGFGPWQDALWPGSSTLWHSRLSAALNVKLLSPQDVVARVLRAWNEGQARLESVEGFLRQIVGWREFVRGIYWSFAPRYHAANALGARNALPQWFWTGDVEARCLRDALSVSLTTGYAHHIQRLMVIGLAAMLLGVDPREVQRWFLAVYVDAVDWVETPNVVGLSQYADGGVVASKPYVASGRYVARMSSGAYCAGCPYDPSRREGSRACPLTVLYWGFVARHIHWMQRHPRLAYQVRSVAALGRRERAELWLRADEVRARWLGGEAVSGSS